MSATIGIIIAVSVFVGGAIGFTVAKLHRVLSGVQLLHPRLKPRAGGDAPGREPTARVQKPASPSRQAKARQPKAKAPSKLVTYADVLNVAVDNSPIAVVVVDKHEDIVLANDASRVLGIVDKTHINRAAWGAALKVFADGEPREIVFRPERSARETRERPIFSVKAAVRLLSDSDSRFIVIYAIDDSENVRMETARRDFVANVSHELKSPVGAVSLMVEALLEAKDDPDSVEYFGGKVMKETQRLGQLITELISLTKLQGAEPLPDFEVLSIDDVVDEAMERCRFAAEAHDISLSTDAPCGATVLGDTNSLVTAVSNLIMNAINYSPEATPVTVTREVLSDRDKGRQVVDVRVTDRGIGIDPEDQKRVFERFFRVDKGRSRRTGGTGLGLAIVKHVAANHDGDIKLWSKPETGSTFTLELPTHD
ncbi:sensor histidine kinase [Corynebacterium parakroppenstedtii]|uniref:sensor histidine kinase n=1 Tax=Corynebacterium parakroppenstedtii TaxID=2828363 RepID=UPI0030ECA357